MARIGTDACSPSACTRQSRSTPTPPAPLSAVLDSVQAAAAAQADSAAGEAAPIMPPLGEPPDLVGTPSVFPTATAAGSVAGNGAGPLPAALGPSSPTGTSSGPNPTSTRQLSPVPTHRPRPTLRERLAECASEYERIQEENAHLATELKCLSRIVRSGSQASLVDSTSPATRRMSMSLEVTSPLNRQRGSRENSTDTPRRSRGSGASNLQVTDFSGTMGKDMSYNGLGGALTTVPSEGATGVDVNISMGSALMEDPKALGLQCSDSCGCNLAEASQRSSVSRAGTSSDHHSHVGSLYTGGGRSSALSSQLVLPGANALSPAPPHLVLGQDRGVLRASSSVFGSLGVTSCASVAENAEMNVLPCYFNPRDVTRQTSTQLRALLTEEEAPNPEKGVLSPVGNFRMLWDLTLFFCLAYDLWALSFQLIFLGNHRNPKVEAGVYAVMTFFFIDIILNFLTGYVRGSQIIMKRTLIVKHYLRFWFWLDLVATVPFDIVIANSDTGGMNSMVRMAKIPKILKTLRFLRMLRTIRHRMEQGDSLGYRVIACVDLRKTLQVPVKYLVTAGWFGVLMLMLTFLAHVHGCIWAALQPEEFFSDKACTPNCESEALSRYFESFHWAFLAFTTGCPPTNLASPAVSLGLWVLEVAISTQRLLLTALLFVWGVFQALIYGEQEVKNTCHKEDMLKYLKKHKVCFETQLQVLHNLEETHESCSQQRHFDQLLKEFPPELRRTICSEMWSGPLLSLGLIMHIAHWNEDLIPELAMLVFEENLCSKSIVCYAGDASDAAYYVVRGALAVVVPDKQSKDVIPDFTDGMWVGEKALVNPGLRRSATVVSRTMSTVMVVPGGRFQELLAHLQLKDRFENFCEDHIWRGLCGRCGVLGDHFSHDCPVMKEQELRGRDYIKSFFRVSGRLVRPAFRRGSSRISDLPDGEREQRQLKAFLRQHRLDRFSPVLEQMDISSISRLKEMNLRQLRIQLEFTAQGIGPLTQAEAKALSRENIERFEQSVRSASCQAVRQKVRDHHLLFLSHYKVEAGTEAALIRSELEHIISTDAGSMGRLFDVPIFLDSEDLRDLNALRDRVDRSHNIVLLLTEGVLSRPWVLVELVTAIQLKTQVLLVEVSKPGNVFSYPDEEFYTSLLRGDVLKQQDMAVLDDCHISLTEVEESLRKVFKRIAVPYSPHRPQTIRHAELQSLMAMVKIRDTDVTGTGSRRSSRSS